MKEKLDYRILRIFPYVVFVLFMIIIIALALLSVTFLLGNSVDKVLFLGTRSGVALTVRVLEYIALVALELMLYRMMLEDRWFAVAYNFLLGYMVADLIFRVASWVGDFYENTATFFILAFIKLLPESFLLVGIYFLIRAFASLYLKMNKEKISLETRRLGKLWVAAHAIFIVGSIVMLPILFVVPPSAKGLFLTLYLAIILYYIVVAALIYLRTKSFCYDYYLYRYNAGEGN